MEAVILVLLLAAPREAEVDRAARRVLSDEAYQTQLPEGTAPTTSATSPGRRSPMRDPNLDGGGGAFATITNLVWWILVAVAAAIGLLWLARELGARFDAAPGSAAAAPAAARRPAAPALADHEALAGAGRYAEAIHALLLRVLAELRMRSEVPSAWTSREVVAHVPLAGETKDGLRTLVHAVERTHFGGLPADAMEYRRQADAATALLETLPARGSRG